MLPETLAIMNWYPCGRNNERSAARLGADLSVATNKWITLSAFLTTWNTRPSASRPKYRDAFIANFKVPIITVIVNDVPVPAASFTDPWWPEVWAIKLAGGMPNNPPKCLNVQFYNMRVNLFIGS